MAACQVLISTEDQPGAAKTKQASVHMFLNPLPPMANISFSQIGKYRLSVYVLYTI